MSNRCSYLRVRINSYDKVMVAQNFFAQQDWLKIPCATLLNDDKGRVQHHTADFGSYGLILMPETKDRLRFFTVGPSAMRYSIRWLLTHVLSSNKREQSLMFYIHLMDKVCIYVQAHKSIQLNISYHVGCTYTHKNV